MNSGTIKPHFELPTRNGLLDIVNGSPILYKTTPKGLEVLGRFSEIEAMLPMLRAEQAWCFNIPRFGLL